MAPNYTNIARIFTQKRDWLHRFREAAAVLEELPVLQETDYGGENEEIFVQSEEGDVGSIQIGEKVEEDALAQAQEWVLRLSEEEVFFAHLLVIVIVYYHCYCYCYCYSH